MPSHYEGDLFKAYDNFLKVCWPTCPPPAAPGISSRLLALLAQCADLLGPLQRAAPLGNGRAMPLPRRCRVVDCRAFG